MEETCQPAKKRARLEKMRGSSLNEILDLTPPIEEDDHIDKVDFNNVNKEISGSILISVDSLKSFVQNIMKRKDSDYFHLELEYSSTLESLEEYKQNSENARKKIAALEDELNEATIKMDEKDKEIEHLRENFNNFGNETKKLICDLQEKLDTSQKNVSEKEERFSKFELLLRESTNEIRNLQQKNQQANKENQLLKENLKEIFESEEKKNFFVLNNEDNNKLSYLLLEKEEELKILELNYQDAIKENDIKEHKIKELDEELLKKNLDIKRLKSRSEKIFGMLKEKDDATKKLKGEFRSHFEVLSRRLAVLEKQGPIVPPNITQILSTLKPIEPITKIKKTLKEST